MKLNNGTFKLEMGKYLNICPCLLNYIKSIGKEEKWMREGPASQSKKFRESFGEIWCFQVEKNHNRNNDREQRKSIENN